MGTMVEGIPSPEFNAFLVNLAQGTPFAISPFPSSTWQNIRSTGFVQWGFVNWHPEEPKVDWSSLMDAGAANDNWRISRYILVDNKGLWYDAAPDSVSHIMCWWGPSFNHTELALPQGREYHINRWWTKLGSLTSF